MRSHNAQWPPEVIIAAVQFSPNLGDGLISECLSGAIDELSEGDIQVTQLDLAGRTDFRPGSGARSKQLQILARLPRPLASIVGGIGATEQARRQLDVPSPSAPLLIGGGHLLSDEHLNFPAKLAVLAHKAGSRPTAIIGIGAEPDTAWPARAIIRRSFEKLDLRYMGARDESTATLLSDLFPSRTVNCLPDLAVLTSQRRRSEVKWKTGFSIAGPTSSHYQSDRRSSSTLRAWWRQTIRAASELGPCLVFTNGSPEDEEFKSTLDVHDLKNVHVAERPQTPSELFDRLTTCDRLVAQRLHAVLPAMVCGIPTVAVDPSKKLRAVVRTVGLPLVSVSTSQTIDIETLFASFEVDASIVERASQDCLASVDAAMKSIGYSP